MDHQSGKSLFSLFQSNTVKVWPLGYFLVLLCGLGKEADGTFPLSVKVLSLDGGQKRASAGPRTRKGELLTPISSSISPPEPPCRCAGKAIG